MPAPLHSVPPHVPPGVRPSVPPGAPDPPPGEREQRLSGLVSTLAAASGPPLLAGIEGLDRDDGALHVKPLASADPVAEIFGFVAPPEWDGLAVSVPGHSVLDRRKLHLAVAITRQDESVSAVLTLGDDEPDLLAHDGPPEGHLPDAMRRILARPNPGPSTPIAEFVASLWLHDVSTRSMLEPGALSWPDVEALLPVDAAAVPDLSWTRLREQWKGGARCAPTLRREVVAWMDDGMFSRWLLAALPRLDDLVAAAHDTLSLPVSRRVTRTLASWGLPPGDPREAC